ncbi:mediator of RNA polymerase II transcription subunit 30-like [Haliotis asinina]|uniref:mediator of RNA polymerase II transcription subunit 30-like n=1 Tax=Haliotis asinina TaxID=109174 RepID=UPI003531DA64
MMAGPGQHYPLTAQMSAPASYQAYQPPPPPPPQMSPQQQMMVQPKEINAALFCRAGQEAVHDLVSKATELFQQMYRLQIPNGVTASPQLYQERRIKIDEQLRIILQMFQKLRVIYNKVNEISIHFPEPPEELLIPLVGSEVDQTSMNNDVYRYVAEEHREIVEQVRMKNQEIKDIIDQIRSIIWEINTMITMRKT